MATLAERMQGAAMLNVATYEEVEHDHTATGQAATVVAIAAVAQAIGSIGRGGPGIVAALVGQLLGWAIWAGLTYFIGTRVFRGTADWGELLRTLGFSQAPGIFFVLGFIPLFGGLVSLAVTIWTAITGVVAVRQALDVTTGQAVATVLIALIPLMIAGALIGRLFGVGI